MMKIGVLALQGAFIEHEQMLKSLGAEPFEIRQLSDLKKDMRGIILPGGESTVIGKLLRDLKLLNPLRELIREGLPVFGTCAGLILLAQNISGGEQPHIGTMNITAKRNAFGRQIASFNEKGAFGDLGGIPMTFIRAPYIESFKEEIEVLAVCRGKTVAARQKNQLVTAFHPELTKDFTVHRYFLEKICG